MWNLLARAGVTLAGLPFIRRLNTQEAYVERIKRDFHLSEYADALHLYSSDPAYWERYYAPLPDEPNSNEALVRDSAAGAGVPSRRNVFEYGYPEPASAMQSPDGNLPRRASDGSNPFVDRCGNWPASPSGGEPVDSGMEEPAAGPPGAPHPDDVRRLTRKSVPTPAAPLTSGSTAVPYLPSREFGDRFGNWDMPRIDGSSRKASRPIGVFAEDIGYTVPPIWGAEDPGNKRQHDTEEWFSRRLRPLLRQE